MAPTRTRSVGRRSLEASALGLAFAGLSTAVALPPYAEGPPLAHTGGFGEPTCHVCHFDQPLNAPGGTLTLEGAPATYEPGETYRLTIRTARPGLKRGGFQAAVRFAGGERAGRPAGTLRALDGRVRVVRAAGSGVEYAQHTEAGTRGAAPDTARWTLEWTAPGDPLAPVVFHVAANASNDDASEFGDFIYAREWTRGPAAEGAARPAERP